MEALTYKLVYSQNEINRYFKIFVFCTKIVVYLLSCNQHFIVFYIILFPMYSVAYDFFATVQVN